jgi:hypothetical protein
MSTPNQYPKTNIVKLNPPSTSTAMKDTNTTDGVCLFHFFCLVFRNRYNCLIKYFIENVTLNLIEWMSSSTFLPMIMSLAFLFLFPHDVTSCHRSFIFFFFYRYIYIYISKTYKTIHSICINLTTEVFFFFFYIVNRLVLKYWNI